jgi:hypothetical protein
VNPQQYQPHQQVPVQNVDQYGNVMHQQQQVRDKKNCLAWHNVNSIALRFHTSNQSSISSQCNTSSRLNRDMHRVVTLMEVATITETPNKSFTPAISKWKKSAFESQTRRES